MRLLTRAVILAAAVFAVAAAPAGAYVFWGKSVGGPSLMRADADGTDVQTLFATPGPAYGLAADGTYVYWTTGGGSIGRARLDGSDVQPSFMVPGGAVRGLAVHGGRIYFGYRPSGGIYRANLDGTHVTLLISVPGAWPDSIALDDDHIYWGDDVSGRIGRANLDGSGVNANWIDGAGAGPGLGVTGSHIYWTRASSVGRANIDGSAMDVDFLPLSGGIGWGLGVDSRWVTWTDQAGAIERARHDGSGREVLAPAASQGAYGLAVNAGPVVELGGAPTFPAAVVGSTGPARTLTVRNQGGDDLTVSGVTMTGSDGDQWTVDATDCTAAPVAPSADCEVELRFAPTSAGAKSATVRISSDAASSPDETAVLASALAQPAVTFGAAPTFPDEVVGDTGPTRTVTVTNAGGSDLTVAGVSMTGADADQFALVGQTCTGAQIVAGGTCEATLRFAPTTAGAKTAAIEIASDAGSSPDDLPLAATALAPPSPPAARPPLVVEIHPAEGPWTGGGDVLLTGSYLSPVTAVRFGDAPAAFRLVGFDRLAVTVPAHAPGVVDVVVTGAGGSSAPVPYRYLAPVVPPPIVDPPPLVEPCVVPDLVGDRRAAARRKLTRAGCALGDVRKADGVPLRRQRVAHQSQAAGAQLPAGTAVDVRLRPPRR